MEFLAPICKCANKWWVFSVVMPSNNQSPKREESSACLESIKVEKPCFLRLACGKEAGMESYNVSTVAFSKAGNACHLFTSSGRDKLCFEELAFSFSCLWDSLTLEGREAEPGLLKASFVDGIELPSLPSRDDFRALRKRNMML